MRSSASAAFRRLFSTHPQRAFEESYDAFRAAGEHSVLSYALTILRDAHSLSDLLIRLEREDAGLAIVAKREPGTMEDLGGEMSAICV